MNEQELIEIAKNTREQEKILELSVSPYSNVRRVIAKNPHTPQSILKELQYDSTVNVSYVANQRLSTKREFRDTDLVNKCVICNKDESTFYIECQKCQKAS